MVVEADDVRITVIGTDSNEDSESNQDERAEKKWKEHDNDMFGDVRASNFTPHRYE